MLSPEQGPGSDTEQGPQEIGLQNHYGFVMPMLYTVQLPTNNPTWVASSNSTTSLRPLYVQYAPNSTFAAISHVLVALALDFANEVSVNYLDSNPGIGFSKYRNATGIYQRSLRAEHDHKRE